MKIEILGIQTISMDCNSFNNPERKHTYHKVIAEFLIDNVSNGKTITITITCNTFVVDKQIEVIHKSKTGFHLTEAKLDYLKEPVNPKTIDIMCELTQVAISHARVFLLLDGEDNKLGRLLLPYTINEDFREFVKTSLLTSLN